MDEFSQARNDLTAGDYKGAIHNACKSFESLLKEVLQRESGNAGELIRTLRQTDFYDDVPEDMRRAFGDSVLMALPFLRNRLGGHGQGPDVVEVPREYAELAVNVAAAFIVFAVQKRPTSVAKEGEPQVTEDEIPF